MREIADEKAGTSEINTLRERNESLSKEISTLTKKQQSEYDRLTESIEEYEKREQEYQNEISTLKNELKFALEDNTIIIAEEASIIIKRMTDTEKMDLKIFIDTMDNGEISLNAPLRDKLKKLGLINFRTSPRIGASSLIITKVGREVYNRISKSHLKK